MSETFDIETFDNMLWDILEDEALVRLYFDREEFIAELPAITIFNQYELGFRAQRKGDKFTLWLGRGIAYWSFKTLQETILKVNELVKSSNAHISVRVETKNKRKVKGIENLVCRN